MGLSSAICEFMFEACLACLDSCNHTSGVEFNTSGSYPSTGKLSWQTQYDTQTARGWQDLQEATEYGATAIAILSAHNHSGWQFLERSAKGTGFDYWLGDENNVGLFQYKARLEISGILRQSKANTLLKRTAQKANQTKQSSGTGLPAHICVTAFDSPEVHYEIF